MATSATSHLSKKNIGQGSQSPPRWVLLVRLTDSLHHLARIVFGEYDGPGNHRHKQSSSRLPLAPLLKKILASIWWARGSFAPSSVPPLEPMSVSVRRFSGALWRFLICMFMIRLPASSQFSFLASSKQEKESSSSHNVAGDCGKFQESVLLHQSYQRRGSKPALPPPPRKTTPINHIDPPD